MSENGFQFRTAAFGGFQKQDVMNYLEQSGKEHAEKVAALQRDLADARVACSEGEEQRAELERRMAALEAENQRLAADLAQREVDLAQMTEARDQVQAQADALQGRVDQLAPLAEAYEAVKDRTASIELEAHGRAQAIERESRDKVKKSQEQVKEWFLRMQGSYERLRSDMTATMSHAVRELERAGQGLEGLVGSMDSHDDALAAIGAQIDALEGVRPPQPLDVEDGQ